MSIPLRPIATLAAAQLPGWSFADLKNQLAQGSLAGWLRANLPVGDVANLQLVAEKQRRDSAALLLTAEMPASASWACATRELVLFYSRAEALLRAWWLPNDPFLPALATLASDPAGLGWQPSGAMLAGPLTLRRLVYNPGQRATLLASAPAGPRAVAKLLRAEPFAEALHKQARLQACGLTEQVTMPRLLASSPTDHALLYEYLPGSSLAELTPALTPALNQALAGCLAAIHGCAPASLASWQPAADIARARHLLPELASIDTLLAGALAALMLQLNQRLARYDRPYTQLIHGDFSAKNVLLQPADSEPSLGRLAVIDWDSAMLGPPEKDLAALLGQPAWHRRDPRPLLQAYARASGRAPDHALINVLVQYQRMLKLCRRLLSGAVQSPQARTTLAEINQQLAQNPFEHTSYT